MTISELNYPCNPSPCHTFLLSGIVGRVHKCASKYDELALVKFTEFQIPIDPLERLHKLTKKNVNEET